jgi:hypothetical protein
MSPDRTFLSRLYFGSLGIRLLIGAGVYLGGYVAYFAGDSWTYDYYGWLLAQAWAGRLQLSVLLERHIAQLGMNGMYYWVAMIYTLIGRSEFAAVVIQCAIASTIPLLVYRISHFVYGSQKAARNAALASAFLPSMVIWTSFLLKESIVIFLLCVTVLCTLKMQRELKIAYALPGAAALFLIFPFRGYIFYFALLAVVGALLMSRFSRSTDLPSYLIRLGGIAVIAVGLFVFDFNRIADQQLNSGILERVQTVRTDQANMAKSGFDAAADVSTLRGAITYLPKGIVYLLLAPFPWQGGGTRMLLAVPETLLSYAFLPYCLIGILYTIRKHLRDALVLLLFVAQLTCFYAIFQGNVGTAHRQRTQIYVFYIVFTCAGWVYSRQKSQGLTGTIDDKNGSSPNEVRASGVAAITNERTGLGVRFGK